MSGTKRYRACSDISIKDKNSTVTRRPNPGCPGNSLHIFKLLRVFLSLINIIKIFIYQPFLLHKGVKGQEFEKPPDRVVRGPSGAPTMFKNVQGTIIMAILWVSAIHLIMKYGL